MGWKRTAAQRLLPDGVYRSICPDLRNEILGLASRRSDRNVAETWDFAESEQSAWRGLASLGYEIVRRYRPRVVVELGTHVGTSAFAMAPALRDLGEGGRLYAGIAMFRDVCSLSRRVRFWKRMARRHEQHAVPYSSGLGIVRVWR